jgi:GMP reductase
MTGVGYPQLSAVMECADAAHGLGGLICSDGGATTPGDIVKAFAGGADFVMCGGMFAGHAECEGEVVGELRPDGDFDFESSTTVNPATFVPQTYMTKVLKKQLGFPAGLQRMIIDEEGKITFKDKTPLTFYKDPSKLKMKFHGMSSKEAMEQHYGGKADYRASEGKEVEVPYKGPVKNTVEEILGGIRSACTYTGAYKLKDLPKVATFAKVNRQLNTVFGNE